MKKLLSLFAILLSLNAVAQLNVDSLKMQLKSTEISDSTRVGALHKIGYNFIFSDPDSAEYYARMEYKIANKMNSDLGRNGAMSTIALSYLVRSDYSTAQEIFKETEERERKTGDKKSLSITLGNMAMLYINTGNLELALKSLQESLELKKSLNLKKGMAGVIGNMGNIYSRMNQDSMALTYFQEGLEVARMEGNRRAIGAFLGNIGLQYNKLGNYDLAMDYQNQSLEIAEELGSDRSKSNTFNHMGKNYYDLKDYQKAIEFYQKSLDISKKSNDVSMQASTTFNIAKAHASLGESELSQAFFEKSMKYAETCKDPTRIYEAALELSKIYQKQKRHEKSLEMYQLHILLRDSVNSEEVKKDLAANTFEKEQLIKEQQQKEAALAAAEKKQRRNSLEYSGITLALFALFGLVFLVGRFQLPNWVIEFSVFLPFLILFEFLLVLTDPYVESYAAGDPMIKLLINACLAGFIFPMHGYFEKVLKRRLFKAA